MGIGADRKGNIYIADNVNKRIRRVDAAGIITTIAGNGILGFSGDGGLADSAELNDPGGIAVDCAGDVFFADGGNYRVRMIAYDHPPVFVGGHSASITVCGDMDTAINAILKVTDTDTGQTETWSITRPAAHGTAMAGYATTTTGDTLTPAGLTYSPAPGYTGNDSFKVRVSDCGFFTDSVTVYVSVVHCGLKTAQATLGNAALTVLPNPNEGSFSINLGANSDEEVQVTITNMLGEKVYLANTTTNKTSTINLNTAAGIYFISASTEGGTYNAKVVVER